ncbi:MAG TPA: Gfo/Idh/MocA family oxidoreductase [Acidobacteriaceae bacterium]|nr:Gfo/Idh/MocA family oxidoreductase [Acidobacteriaceae bacterium]
MRVGIIGTGAMSHKHAQAYRNIGWELTVCTNTTAAKGRTFTEATGAEFVANYEELICHPRVDVVDICTLPGFRLPAVELSAKTKKHVIVEKPIATNLETARKMMEVADNAGIQLGVVSQHRFDDSTQFLKQAIANGRLGTIIEADAYVKWYRSAEYYSRPIKGSWTGEGGGALINQAIHQLDVLLYLMGPLDRVTATWQLGAAHQIESEDVVNALLTYANGATGVLQASTALWPGYPERIEIHGTKGSAIVTGDKLTRWDVQDDTGESAPIDHAMASGASDPMAISTLTLERQFLDFGDACATGRAPLVSALEGYRALEAVISIYESCRQGRTIVIDHTPRESEPQQTRKRSR